MSDDLFMFHDRIFSKYLGIPEALTYVIYIMVSMLFLACFAPVIIRTGYRVFFAAGILFAISVGLDVLSHTLPVVMPHENFLEDSFKLFGIGTWCYYSFRPDTIPL